MPESWVMGGLVSLGDKKLSILGGFGQNLS
jgi:hypothetical protein